MPYIITITQREITESEGAWRGSILEQEISRTAVATLDEARDYTFNARVNDDSQIEPLSESGGTFGPLPDGTVIEVQYFDWAAMDNLTWGSTRRLRDPEVIGDAERATLSHFNHREVSA